jgi:hypothetical protein
MASSLPRRAAWVLLLCSLLLSTLNVDATALDTYSQAEALVRQGQWDQGIDLLLELLKKEAANL